MAMLEFFGVTRRKKMRRGKGGNGKTPGLIYKGRGINGRHENQGASSGKRGRSCRLDLQELIK